MNKVQTGLVTTLVLGIFILIGSLIAFLIKKKEKVVDFSIGLAFSVIVMLMITDLFPEIIEDITMKKGFIFLIAILSGYLLLKGLDHFIPDHEEEKMTKKGDNSNLFHIGLITSLALILHNIIEGMAIYSATVTSSDLGFMMMIGVGFHNIPLGMVIASTFYQSNQNIYKTIIIILGVSLSTFLGGFILFLCNMTEINSLLLGILLSITFGMLIFIAISELLPRLLRTRNKKTTAIGIVLGIIILFIATLL